MPAHDPEVQDAANHAIKTIQQRSNSIFPHELKEILLAKAEVSSLYLYFFIYLCGDMDYLQLIKDTPV